MRPPIVFFPGTTGTQERLGTVSYRHIFKITGGAHVQPARHRGLNDPAKAARVAEREIMRQIEDTGMRFVAIGFSQGGLQALHIVLNHPTYFKGLVLMNTPLRGASFCHRLSPMPLMRGLAPGNAFLKELQTRYYDQHLSGGLPPVTTMAFWRDLLVPWQAAWLPGARNLLFVPPPASAFDPANPEIEVRECPDVSVKAPDHVVRFLNHATAFTRRPVLDALAQVLLGLEMPPSSKPRGFVAV